MGSGCIIEGPSFSKLLTPAFGVRPDQRTEVHQSDDRNQLQPSVWHTEQTFRPSKMEPFFPGRVVQLSEMKIALPHWVHLILALHGAPPQAMGVEERARKHASGGWVGV